MKKLILLFAVLFVLSCMLIGCGGTSTDTDTDKNTDTTIDTSKDTSDKSDTDTDMDTNTDTDTDTDTGTTDTDADTDTDTGSDKPDVCTHEYGDWQTVTAPTCTEKGFEKRNCTLCGFTSSRSVDARGHNVIVDEAIEGDCTKDGYTQGAHCDVCNTVLKAQQLVPKDTLHKYVNLVRVDKEPTTSSEGKATFRCSTCNGTRDETLAKLTSQKLGKDDVYDITTDEFNPAIDNIWKMVDGNTSTGGLYGAGNDWFGNIGDTLVITLGQEVILNELSLYVCGNFTSGSYKVKNAKGEVTKSGSITVNNTNTEKKTVISNGNVKAYTIEVSVTGLKWESYLTFKVAEVEMKATKQDPRLPHDHVYREYVKDTVKATCLEGGKAEYACYCGLTKEKTTPTIDHNFSVLYSKKDATCTENGRYTYKCETCNDKREKQIIAKGHVFAKLVNYVTMPTLSQNGKAVFKCIGCDLTENKTIIPLTLGSVEHLRVSSMLSNMVTLKFNVYGESGNYEIRYSTSEITNENFANATLIDATVTGDKEYTAKLNLSVGLNSCYYVAIRPYIGENYGNVTTIRLGGNKLIPIDYEKNANVYSGEVLNSFAKMFDEQAYEKTKNPTSVLGKIFNDSSDLVLYGMKLRPIVDLQAMHYVSSVYLFYMDPGVNVTVRWSDTPVDFMAEDSKWDGVKKFTTAPGWNEIQINNATRYIQVEFKDGSAPYEMLIYGFQNGDGDEIATEIGSLPTMGEMMGMCGFVASGGGNTPIDSVICTTVLREYHNFGWSYTIDNYPNKATFFSGSWMGDFDEQYRKYSQAGINVIPCIQWDLVNIPQSYKVDSNNLPRKSNGSFIKGDFYDKMNPHTYFAYADNMFSFSARFGTNTAIGDLLFLHASGTKQSGFGTIKWIELGNEPEGAWNGVHNYYSAYQLAALTSAAYDGHCRTMTSSVIDKGYHLGVKNGDPNMKAAMAGVSAVSNEYITSMCYWMKANRADGKTAFDAFNVHCYMTKSLTLANGSSVSVGASPEEANVVKTLSNLIALRDKYYPEKEVWITEFGWDTNQSYATSTSAHGYENKDTGVSYTGREVQAMWLTRTYLLLSAIGIDKATMYMCEDCGVEEESVGKYGTAGVIGFKYDENGNTVEFKKESYYYLYTLKNTLGDYTFNQKIEAYEDNVMIYQYKTAEGKVAYAVWCPTSDGTVVKDYQLGIGGSSATLVQNENGDIDGVNSTLRADNLGYVTIDISEKPIYIVVD